MAAKTKYGISGTVKTQVGILRFSLTVTSRKSIGATAEQFERDNPDCKVTEIHVFGSW